DAHMPPGTNLEQRIANDPDWSASFQNRLPKATEVANGIPLVHVTGVRPGSKRESGTGFERLLRIEAPEIPTSADLHYCSNETRQTEDSLGLRRSVYFYAGRACEDFGDVALAFGPECERGHNGSASPFDTGGLLNGRIKANIPASERAAVGRDSVVDLG